MENKAATDDQEVAAERRSFLRTAGMAAAGIVGASVLAPKMAQADGPPKKFKDIPFPRYLNLPGHINAGYDVKVLNYALLLEDLETDLYIQAIQRLTSGGVNDVGKTISGLNISSMEPDVQYLSEFTLVEAEHRDFLRGSLNSLIKGIAIKPFKYDFNIESKSRQEVVDLILDVEMTGALAYLGAIPQFHTKLFVTAAAAIQGTEARHTATVKILREELFGPGGPASVAPSAKNNHGADTPLDPNTVLAKVAPFIV